MHNKASVQTLAGNFCDLGAYPQKFLKIKPSEIECESDFSSIICDPRLEN